MKLWKVWTLVGITAGVIGAVGYGAGCSGDDTSNNNGTVGQPPAKPTTGTTPAGTDTMTFAVQKLFLGEAPRSGGAASSTAWKDYGYNIDGVVTTKDATDVCTLATGASKNNQIDGNNGTDNAFGAVILPIIQSAASLNTPSQTINDTITKGSFTLELSIKGLTSDAKQTSTGLTGDLFAAGNYDPDGGTAPAFDMTTDWPVRPELLVDQSDISKGSKVHFDDAYVVNGTFVNGASAPGTAGVKVTISLVFSGVALDLSINHAIITFDHSAPTDATNGTIAGVINTQQLIDGLKSVAGRISTSLCGSAFDGIAQQIKQASDILSDGSNSSGKACDAISIGLGFSAKQIANPTKIAALGTASPDPCSTDGGTPDSGTPDSGTTDAGSADAASE